MRKLKVIFLIQCLDSNIILDKNSPIARVNRWRQKTFNKPTSKYRFQQINTIIAKAWSQIDFDATVYDTQLYQVGDSTSEMPTNIFKQNLGFLWKEETKLDESKVQLFDSIPKDKTQNQLLKIEGKFTQV